MRKGVLLLTIVLLAACANCRSSPALERDMASATSGALLAVGDYGAVQWDVERGTHTKYTVRRGRFNHFQGGSIYWTPETGAEGDQILSPPCCLVRSLHPLSFGTEPCQARFAQQQVAARLHCLFCVVQDHSDSRNPRLASSRGLSV